jgi:parallel beta-helix repeat protein
LSGKISPQVIRIAKTILNRRYCTVQFKLVLLCSLVLCFSVVVSTKTCIAQETAFIYIRADGSIDPPTAPISTLDNVTYTLTGDIFNDSIVVEKDNIVVDGGFQIVEGTGSGNGIRLLERTNVTIKNMTIKAFDQGISIGPFSNYNTIFGNNITNNYGLSYSLNLVNSRNNTIYGNNITDNAGGIGLYNCAGNSISGNNIIANNAWGISIDYYSSNNNIYGNNITNNFSGIALDSSSNNNTIYHNNFMNNASQVGFSGSNVWDNGSEGNYWSDYNGTDSNQDGIGDTPYTIDANNIDHYPLMAQYVIPEFLSFLVMPLFMIVILLAIAIYKRRHLTRA